MTRPDKELDVPITGNNLPEETIAPPGRQKPYYLSAISPEMQLKWGLALLGEQKSLEYLKWLTERIEQQSQ